MPIPKIFADRNASMSKEEGMSELFRLDGTPVQKPIKCKHCGMIRGMHKAQTFQCPAKWSKGRAGYTHYVEQVYEPKETK